MSPSYQMSQDTYVGEYVFTVYRLLAPEYRMTLYTLYLSYDYLLFYIELFRLYISVSCIVWLGFLPLCRVHTWHQRCL